jgi:periodic tryptophan protein 2
VASAYYHPQASLLVVGFSDGVFGLYELPDCSVVHTLSVSHGGLGTVCLNKTGEWLALGCGPLGQLLVWEWQSETYVLKQQGHADAVTAVAFAPDGQALVTGGDDAKVKLWSAASGFSYATFTAHEAPITSLAFLGSGQAILSASLDGTVRAHDLLRYRNFRTLTTPTPTQLLSLAVDPSGEVVCAGGNDPFEVYVWALQTGKLLEILPGHGGPVVALDFSPTEPILASGSWDGTVKMWNVYKKELIETHTHTSDVLSVAFRPDGKELCVCTLNGTLHFWDVTEGHEVRVIDGKRDIRGGRGLNDKVSAANSAASKHFTSVAYTADGSCVIAGGKSKFVCIYHCESQVLLKKFQLSHDRALDGVLDILHSGRVGPDGQSLDTIDVDEEDDDSEAELLANEGKGGEKGGALPGAKRGIDGSKRRVRPEVRSSCVRFSPTGREWAAATPQGLMVYALEEDMIFNPLELDEAATPEAVSKKIAQGEVAVALVMAAQLNEEPVMVQALEAAPPTPEGLALLARTLPPSLAPRLLSLLAKRLPQSPHLAYLLQWSLALLQAHGPSLRKDPAR